MKKLNRETNGKWTQIDESNSNDVEALQNTLKELLLCENLIVLSGLGTSLCVKNRDGKKVASTMNDLWDAVKNELVEKFEKVVEKVNYKKPEIGDSIELLLSQCQISEALKPDSDVESFIEIAEKIIVQKCNYDMSTLDLTVHESFLRRVARRSARQPRMKLFTTNYDRCFESAATNSRFTIIDGFSHSLPQEFDGIYFSYDLVKRGSEGENPDFIPNEFQLYKLHGSVDWERQESRVVKNINPKRALIIYPRSNKFESSYEPPFVEIMGSFLMALRTPNTALLILGCGFNDKHIIEPIMSSVRSNINLKVAVVSPDLESSKNIAVNKIETLIENGDPRLCLLNITFEEIIKYIPDLISESETEQHEKRVRRLI